MLVLYIIYKYIQEYEEVFQLYYYSWHVNKLNMRLYYEAKL